MVWWNLPAGGYLTVRQSGFEDGGLFWKLVWLVGWKTGFGFPTAFGF
jgi:hypothetical protein